MHGWPGVWRWKQNKQPFSTILLPSIWERIYGLLHMWLALLIIEDWSSLIKNVSFQPEQQLPAFKINQTKIKINFTLKVNGFMANVASAKHTRTKMDAMTPEFPMWMSLAIQQFTSLRVVSLIMGRGTLNETLQHTTGHVDWWVLVRSQLGVVSSNSRPKIM